MYNTSAVPNGLAFRVGSNATKLVIDQTGQVGIGTTAPGTVLDVNGGLSIEPNSSITLTADNQSVNVGDESYLRIASDNATSTNRTITLTDGLVTGQILFIECTSNAMEVADNAATNNTNTTITHAMGSGDVIQLIWNGTDWIEVSFANN